MTSKTICFEQRAVVSEQHNAMYSFIVSQGNLEPAPPRGSSGGSSGKKGAGAGTILGVPIMILLIAGFCVAGCPLMVRTCGSSESDTAMKALRACPAARQALGDDVDWANVGCANCKSRSGGDPVNGGCHGSSSWQLPVAGSRGRGSYSFSFSSSGGRESFNGGFVRTSSGVTIQCSATSH